MENSKKGASASLSAWVWSIKRISFAFFSRNEYISCTEARNDKLRSIGKVLLSNDDGVHLYTLISDFDRRYSVGFIRFLNDLIRRVAFLMPFFLILSSVRSIAIIFRLIFTASSSRLVTLILIFLVNVNKSAQNSGNNCKNTISAEFNPRGCRRRQKALRTRRSRARTQAIHPRLYPRRVLPHRMLPLIQVQYQE